MTNDKDGDEQTDCWDDGQGLSLHVGPQVVDVLSGNGYFVSGMVQLEPQTLRISFDLNNCVRSLTKKARLQRMILE